MDLPTLTPYNAPLWGICPVCTQARTLTHYDVGIKRSVCLDCAKHLANAHRYLSHAGFRQHNPCELPDRETHL